MGFSSIFSLVELFRFMIDEKIMKDILNSLNKMKLIRVFQKVVIKYICNVENQLDKSAKMETLLLLLCIIS